MLEWCLHNYANKWFSETFHVSIIGIFSCVSDLNQIADFY